jgi:hypothetical protein
MDYHFRSDVRLLPYTRDGTQHVFDLRKAETAHEQILWNKIHRPAWFSGPLLFHICGNHVPCKKNTRQAGVDGKAEAKHAGKNRLKKKNKLF